MKVFKLLAYTTVGFFYLSMSYQLGLAVDNETISLFFGVFMFLILSILCGNFARMIHWDRTFTE